MILAPIVRSALRHPGLVLVCGMLLLVYGVFAVSNARYDVFPEFVPPQATVQTEAPGLAAEQVEALVTRPLEAAIIGTNGVTSVRSESVQGLSVINVIFAEGSDPFRTRQVLAEALSETNGRLPANVAVPVLSPLTSSTMDLLKIGFVAPAMDPMRLRDIVQWQVRTRLLAVPGVARAIVFGGDERRLDVRMRPEAMIARGVTLADLTAAVQAAAAVRGGGFTDSDAQRVIVTTAAPRLRAADLASAPLPLSAGAPIRIGDVADVMEAATPKSGDALVMGKRGALMALSSQYGANTLTTTLAVEKALAELTPALNAQGITVYPRLHRPANFIESALSGISRDLVVGAAMIGLVLLLFLRSLRVALVIFLAIPLSLLAALIVLGLLGQTINTMTLGGLAVALGVVIDDAIVDVENIVRRLGQHPRGNRLAVIAAASVEVRAPVVYATFVLLLTIMPVLFLTGLQGAFFAPLALAFALAVLASLLVALTMIPALALLVLSPHAAHRESALPGRLQRAHERLVARICAAPRAVAATTALVGVLALAAFGLFGSELLPAFRERHYVMQVSGPAGASITWMRQLGTRISRDLLALPEIASVEHQIGRAEAGEDTFPPHRSEFHVELSAAGGRDEVATQDKIRAVLARYPGLQSEVLTFLGDRISESLSGETAALAIGIYGADLDTLDRVAADVAQVVRQVPGAADVQIKAAPGAPSISVVLDPARMAVRGVSAADAADAIETAFQGRVVAERALADQVNDIAITLAPGVQQDPEAIGGLLVRSVDGVTTRLADIATLVPRNSRLSINHDNGLRRQIVTANPAGRDVGSFTAAVQAAIARHVALPKGVFIDYAGQAEGQAAALRQLALNVGTAAIGIAMLLVLAFGGVRPALLIAAGTPFALAGGVAAVALTGGVLSLGALVGFVTLFGIAARNAILLISHVDQLTEQEGMPFDLATILRATRERVTPIIVTALVTGLGLAPLALEAGQSGREVQGPMAAVILGGLVTSTLMSLVLLPALILAWRRPPSPPASPALP
ncbi:MAG: efflux RND transporter permease subunit [Sphingomonadales bacterium]|jgi:CzcA family heavy metal efflux pump